MKSPTVESTFSERSVPMTWANRWRIESTLPDGSKRSTDLDTLLHALDLYEEKPADESGFVLQTISALKTSMSLQKVEAYFDGNLLLGV